MTIYVVDGSQKGLVMGAGVVEVNDHGFFQPYHFTTYHVEANSLLSEIFAFESVLTIIKKNKEMTTTIHIHTDNNTVIKLFEDDLKNEHLSRNSYILGLQNQLLLIKKFARVSVSRITDNLQPIAHIAHDLSRSYLKDPNIDLYMPRENKVVASASPLPSNKEKKIVPVSPSPSKKEKKVVPVSSSPNKKEKKVKLQIKREGSSWKLLANGQLVNKHSKFLTVIEQYVTSHESALGDSLFIQPCGDLDRMLKAIKKNKKVNTILTRMNKALV